MPRTTTVALVARRASRSAAGCRPRGRGRRRSVFGHDRAVRAERARASRPSRRPVERVEAADRRRVDAGDVGSSCRRPARCRVRTLRRGLDARRLRASASPLGERRTKLVLGDRRRSRPPTWSVDRVARRSCAGPRRARRRRSRARARSSARRRSRRCGRGCARRSRAPARRPTPPSRSPGQPTTAASGLTRRGATSATPRNSAERADAEQHDDAERARPLGEQRRREMRAPAERRSRRRPASTSARRKRDGGSVAPSRTAAIGGTRVARSAGTMLGDERDQRCRRRATTTTVRAREHRARLGQVERRAPNSALRPFGEPEAERRARRARRARRSRAPRG